MSSYVRVFLVGTLGNDLELKQGKNGKPYCRMALATDGYAKEGEEKRTSWHSVHAFGRQAELAHQYLKKGRQVLVEGRMESKPIQKGAERFWQTWLTADHITFLGRPNEGGSEAPTMAEAAAIPAAEVAEEIRF